MRNQKILLLGAAGVTGQMTRDRLLAVGCEVTAAGRDARKLRLLGGPFEIVDTGDRVRLAELCGNHAVVVNCAGPYDDTGPGVVETAIATGTHYVDCSWEQAFIRNVQGYDAAARAAGVTVAPGFGLSPSMSDYLFHRACGRFTAIDEIAIAYGQGSGNPTLSFGTLITTAAIVAEGGVEMRGGALVSMRVARRRERIYFRQKFGAQPAIAFPGASIVTIPRGAAPGQLASARIHHSLSLEATTRLLPLIGKLRTESRVASFALRNVVKIAGVMARFNIAGTKGFTKMITVRGLDASSGRAARTMLSVAGDDDPYTYTAEILALSAARLARGDARRGVCSAGTFFTDIDLVRSLRLTLEDEHGEDATDRDDHRAADRAVRGLAGTGTRGDVRRV